MISALICWYNIFCHIDNYYDNMQSKYPPDVVRICEYFEQQKAELPEYCFYQPTATIPRRRSEF